MQRALIILGLLLLAAGLLWPVIGKLGLGRFFDGEHQESAGPQRRRCRSGHGLERTEIGRAHV